MPDNEFETTSASFGPATVLGGPSSTELSTLRDQALVEGRKEDAAEYERMRRLLIDHTREMRNRRPLWKTTGLAAVVATTLVLAIRYFM